MKGKTTLSGIMTILLLFSMITMVVAKENKKVIYRGEPWEFGMIPKKPIYIIIPDKKENSKVENGFVLKMEQKEWFPIELYK